MQPLARDTPRHIEQEIMALLRTLSFAEKGQRMTEMNAALDQFALAGIRRYPRPDPPHLQLALRKIDVERHPSVRPLLEELSLTMSADPITIAVRVGSILDTLGISYYVGGSFASSFFGEFRATRDIDVILQTPVGIQRGALRAALEPTFSFHAEDLTTAYMHRMDPETTYASFAIYDRESGYQVDMFLAPQDRYSRVVFQRRIRADLVGGPLWIPAVEDAILAKLRWYTLSPSDQQWRDVQGMLRVQQSDVNFDYLRTWGRALNIETLVEAAILGERPTPPENLTQPPLF
jgi:hypothetical protein